jgi:hypothetical protein
MDENETLAGYAVGTQFSNFPGEVVSQVIFFDCYFYRSVRIFTETPFRFCDSS